MADVTHQIPRREKIGYAMGDVATNFFFQSMILYQTRFYTDTAGLSAVAVGTMFLVLRLADAAFDPIIGALSDRTRTRWGNFRPWILWTAVPFGLIFWAVYVTPDAGPQTKLIYAYITYTLVMMLYSANNTPYSALMGVMTPDASERSSIASYRFVGALIGQFVIQALPLPARRQARRRQLREGLGAHHGHLRRADHRAEPHHVRDDEGTGPGASGRTASDQGRPEGRLHLPPVARDVHPHAVRVHDARRARQFVELPLRLLHGSEPDPRVPRRARPDGPRPAKSPAGRPCSTASACS